MGCREYVHTPVFRYRGRCSKARKAWSCPSATVSKYKPTANTAIPTKASHVRGPPACRLSRIPTTAGLPINTMITA